MTWWRRCWSWLRMNMLEGRLQRGGYRRLHEEQVADVNRRTKRVIHDLADAVIALRTVADEVETALVETVGEAFDDL